MALHKHTIRRVKRGIKKSAKSIGRGVAYISKGTVTEKLAKKAAKAAKRAARRQIRNYRNINVIKKTDIPHGEKRRKKKK